MTRKMFGMGSVIALLLVGLATNGPRGFASRSGSDSQPTVIPPYHHHASRAALPTTLPPSQFPDVVNQKTYALAARIKAILYQQPCYCPCSREEGHKSLLDCFVDAHASICDVCKQEAVYAYRESRSGKSAGQIRKGIIKGEWQKVDLNHLP